MRRFLLASVAGLAAIVAAPLAEAQTVKVVMHSDVKALDPVWSGAYITRNHGYMLYDTLFALDENLQVKPQMVDKWETSPDGRSNWLEGAQLVGAYLIMAISFFFVRSS